MQDSKCCGNLIGNECGARGCSPAADGAFRFRREVVMSLSLLVMALALSTDAASPPQLDPADLGVPFRRYTTTDSLGRTTTFYLSIAPHSSEGAKLPVALIIQGSGCQSLFTMRWDKIYGSQ